MAYALFYDTETTGFARDGVPNTHPSQPHLVQVAACLVDLDTRRTVASMDVVVRPNTWVIPPEVTAIHGISTEFALEVDVPEIVAVDMLTDLADGVLRVAHNEAFDSRIVSIAIERNLDHQASHWLDAVANPTFCTMQAAAPVMQLPPTARQVAAGYGGQFKAPKLSEAYRHFMGRDMINAHNAMADVQACMAVYFALQDMAGGTEP